MNRERSIFITGAGGYFAWELIRQLSQKEFSIVAVSSDKRKIEKYYSGLNIKCVSNNEVLGVGKYMGNCEFVVHTAFCRKSDGELLLNSIKFLKGIAHLAMESGVKGFINLSSQSVYGHMSQKLPDEEGRIAPGYLYALAKSFSEQLLDEVAGGKNGKMAYTNVRLASLIGPGSTIPQNVLYKFITQGIQNKEFKVIGGGQNFSFLDVRDAAKAIQLLLDIPTEKWKTAYNLGPEKQTNILDMAEIVRKKVYEQTGIQAIYKFEKDDIQLNVGMDSSLLYEVLGWKPEYSFEDTVEDTVKFIMNEQMQAHQ